LVPARSWGTTLDRLLQRAREVAASCRAAQPAERNAGLVLGAIMGALAVHPTAPRDKLTLLTSRELAPLGRGPSNSSPRAPAKRAWASCQWRARTPTHPPQRRPLVCLSAARGCG
jgi:hypothetical protein